MWKERRGDMWKIIIYLYINLPDGSTVFHLCMLIVWVWVWWLRSLMLELGLLCGIIKCMHLNNFSNSLTMTSGNSDSDSPTVTSVGYSEWLGHCFLYSILQNSGVDVWGNMFYLLLSVYADLYLEFFFFWPNNNNIIIFWKCKSTWKFYKIVT